MIDGLPLDFFDSDAPEPVHEGTVRLALCQWCGVKHPADRVTCPDCGAMLLRASVEPERDPPTVMAALLTHCPWCSAAVEPADDVCPGCHAALLVDPNLVLPGVNVPLPESVVLARVREEMAREDDDETAEMMGRMIRLLGEAVLRSGG